VTTHEGVGHDLVDWVCTLFMLHLASPNEAQTLVAKRLGFNLTVPTAGKRGRGRPASKPDALDDMLGRLVAHLQATWVCDTEDASEQAARGLRLAETAHFAEQVCRWQFGGNYCAIRKRERPSDTKARLRARIAGGMSKAEAISAEGLSRSTGYRLLREC